jgi:hypothetical protein
MNSISPGSAAVPWRARRSERWTIFSNSSSDSGSVHPASRSPSAIITPPTTAKITTTIAMPCSRRSGAESANPARTAMAARPTHAATTDAKAMRRRGGIYLIVRAMTRRWTSFVPS